MIGAPKVIATRQDFDLARVDNPELYAEFVAALKGSLISTADTQVYPAGYDSTLKDGDAGYVAPIISQVEDLSTIERFGFTKAEVLAL
ncbi:MAG: hypothetical protein GC139_10535 [Sideroxydans sp.]|nr:hypothetical protein [Sideroxydans sp.]